MFNRWNGWIIWCIHTDQCILSPLKVAVFTLHSTIMPIESQCWLIGRYAILTVEWRCPNGRNVHCIRFVQQLNCPSANLLRPYSRTHGICGIAQVLNFYTYTVILELCPNTSNVGWNLVFFLSATFSAAICSSLPLGKPNRRWFSHTWFDIV